MAGSFGTNETALEHLVHVTLLLHPHRFNTALIKKSLRFQPHANTDAQPMNFTARTLRAA